MLAAVAGSVAMGPVAAQNGTSAANDTANGTDTANDTSAANDTDGTDSAADDPEITYVNGTGGLRARFADANADTVESIPQRTINFNIVNTQYDGPYTVTITAAGMNQSTVERVVYDNETGLSRFGLEHYDVIGFDFTGVQPGSYEVTASPVDADAEVTVPIRVTGPNGTVPDDAPGMDNGTGMEGALENLTISAAPPAANTTANHTLTATADVGNVTGIAVNYSGSNVSLSGVGTGTVVTANVTANGTNTSILPNLTTATVQPSGESIVFETDGTPTLNTSGTLVMTYTGVANPPEPGTYDVSVRVNPETMNASPASATLDISAANATMDTDNQTPMGANATNQTPMGANATNRTPVETTMGTNATEETPMGTNATDGTTAGTTGTTAETTDAAEEATDTTVGVTETTAEAAETTAEATETTDDGTPAGGPGFGVVAAAVAVLAVALVAARRR